MIESLFIFTAAMVLTGTFKFIGMALGNGMTLPLVVPLPNDLSMSPTHFLIWYPSLMFQIDFWARTTTLKEFMFL